MAAEMVLRHCNLGFARGQALHGAVWGFTEQDKKV
jgi:hypothetical protein